jgi:hypothetical protein
VFLFYTVFLLILKRDRAPSRPKASSQKLPPMRFFIITTILEHFDVGAFGCDGHGHASKSKETLYT